VAAARGDRALFDALRLRFETTTVPAERSRLLYALGRFRDPALVEEALRFALAPAVRPQEILVIPRSVMTESNMRERASRWLLEHYDEIAGRVPQMVVAFMPARALRQVCSADGLAQVRTFFSDPKHLAPGTEKELAKASEAVQDCIALRAREGESARAYLRTVDPR
jgi:alanyl aminopeptidase